MINTIKDLEIGQHVITPLNRKAKVLKLIKKRSSHKKKEEVDRFERVLLQYTDMEDEILDIKGINNYGASRVLLQPKLLTEAE